MFLNTIAQALGGLLTTVHPLRCEFFNEYVTITISPNITGLLSY
jgi:hypothetical protein